MKKITKNNWQEPTAYGISLISFIVGVSYNVKTIDCCSGSIFLTPAGSVIIICGVLLAFSRKMENIEKKVKSFINSFFNENMDSIINEHQNQDGTELSEKLKSNFKDKLAKETHKDVDEVLSDYRRIFKMHEVILVSFGTFINGFGDLVFKSVFCD